MPGIVAIHNSEVALVPEQVRMPAQNAVAYGMKGAAPEGRQILSEEVRYAAHHFLGGFVGEREQEDPVGWNPLLQQVSHAIRQRAGLARTRTGNHQSRTRRRGDRGVLLLVQFASVIDL